MIPNNGRRGICPDCECETELTNDHVVPKWLLSDTARFGVNYREIIDKAGIKGKTWRDLCTACNLAKGGTLIYNDQIVRLYLKAFVEAISAKLYLYEFPRKIQVVCQCRDGVLAFEKVVAKKNVISSMEAHDTSHKHWLGTCWCGHKS